MKTTLRIILCVFLTLIYVKANKSLELENRLLDEQLKLIHLQMKKIPSTKVEGQGEFWEELQRRRNILLRNWDVFLLGYYDSKEDHQKFIMTAEKTNSLEDKYLDLIDERLGLKRKNIERNLTIQQKKMYLHGYNFDLISIYKEDLKKLANELRGGDLNIQFSFPYLSIWPYDGRKDLSFVWFNNEQNVQANQ